MIDNFLGKWILVPEESIYEQGTPPKRATYSFKTNTGENLIVSINWTDSENKDHEITYEMIPDGLRKKFENPQIVYEVMSEFTA